MKQEYEDILVQKYPLLYADYKGDATKTCMHWGFAVGDGWFNIINGLSAAIQAHIDWKNKNADEAEEWNAMVQAGKKPSWWREGQALPALRPVPDRVSQVVVAQVKEKFGSLRFYIDGGDDTIDNFITMAEFMSAITCEECGAPGEMSMAGWARVRCPACEAALIASRGELNED